MIEVFNAFLYKLLNVNDLGQHLCVRATFYKSLQVLIYGLNTILVTIVDLQDFHLFIKTL